MNGKEKEFLVALSDLIKEHGSRLTVIQILGVLDFNCALLRHSVIEKWLAPESPEAPAESEAFEAKQEEA